MSGYNTVNLLTASKTFAADEIIDFRMSNSDSSLFRAQVKCTTADGASAIVETSWDGGLTWATLVASAALSDATTNTYVFGSTTATSGPLARIKFTGGAPVIASIWITRRL